MVVQNSSHRQNAAATAPCESDLFSAKVFYASILRSVKTLTSQTASDSWEKGSSTADQMLSFIKANQLGAWPRQF